MSWLVLRRITVNASSAFRFGVPQFIPRRTAALAAAPARWMATRAKATAAAASGAAAKPKARAKKSAPATAAAASVANESQAKAVPTARAAKSKTAATATAAASQHPRAAKAEAAADDDAVASADAPALLLAKKWDGAKDVTGWWMSEKLDGVRCYWNGRQFLSRLGKRIYAPDWFTRGLPVDTPLDGELFSGRGVFQTLVGIVKTQSGLKDEDWKTVTYQIFDAPARNEPFEQRCDFINKLVEDIASENAYVRAVKHTRCDDTAALTRELSRVLASGGEGLMLREPASPYEGKRSSTLLKVKSFDDTEAEVISHAPGKGKYTGLVGALNVRLANGIEFAVGSGLTDAQRAPSAAPPVGAIVTVRYQGKSNAGTPRFATFVAQRFDFDWIAAVKAETAKSAKL